MNKISQRDRIILTALLAIAFIVIAFYSIFPDIYAQSIDAEMTKQSNQTKVRDAKPIKAELDSLKKENDLLLESINAYKDSLRIKGLSKQEILVYLTQSAQNNDVEVVRFKFLSDTRESNGVWRVCFNYELRGAVEKINKVNDTMHSLGLDYSVGSMSFRQNREYPYLLRPFDNEYIFKWYKNEPSVEKSQASSASPPPRPVFTDNVMKQDVVLEYVMFTSPDVNSTSAVNAQLIDTPVPTPPPADNAASPSPSPSATPGRNNGANNAPATTNNENQ